MIRRVAAIALLGIRAPLRSRLVLGLLALLAVILAGIRGDGTAQGEMRMLLTWTLGVAAGVLGAATLWAGCAAVASDIEAGRHAPTAVSPARPFEIWLGRWLGLVVVNGALLLVAVAAAHRAAAGRSAPSRPPGASARRPAHPAPARTGLATPRSPDRACAARRRFRRRR